MEWVSNWIQGIIVAVIISTIIEMILPQGNCKKYIKVVIGVYILFSMISPVINKITGNNFRLSNILNIEEYAQASTGNTYQELNNNQEKQIKEVYITSLKNDMKQKISSKGYEVLAISLNISDNGEYELQEIHLKLNKKIENENVDENITKNTEIVNEVKIQVSNSENSEPQTTQNQTASSLEEQVISNQEQKLLKQYLSSTYEVEESNIHIV